MTMTPEKTGGAKNALIENFHSINRILGNLIIKQKSDMHTRLE